MKTLTIIFCVLAITTMAYGFNLARYYKFHMNLCMCEKEWYTIMNKKNKPPAADMFRCATLRDRNLYDSDGHYDPYETAIFLQDLIEDQSILEKALLIFSQCYYQGYKQDVEPTIYISECAFEILLSIGNPNLPQN